MTEQAQSRKIAETAITAMLELLNTPPCEDCWWESLAKAEKTTLLRHAELDYRLRKKPWNVIPPAHRRRVLDSAMRASKWASDLIVVIEVTKNAKP